jgi:hypothetical protein
MDATRITCTRCRANNFPGQTQCWRCGHSLPPPEALEPSRNLPVCRHAPVSVRRPQKLQKPFVPVVLCAVILLSGLLVFAFRSWRQQDLRTELATTNDRLLREPPFVPSGITADPLAEQAQRELERLQREIGMSKVPISPDGQVHLRSGGTISPEEWKRAAKSLGR